jgi:hypothetical protein
MGLKSGPAKEPAERVVKEIRRATRCQFSTEEKIRIVLPGLRGEEQHCRAVPPRRHCPEPLLPLVEGVPGGWHLQGALLNRASARVYRR